MSAESDAFYADLPGFIEFPDVTDLSRYVPLPDDWSVVIADIKGSTKAIREGRYKEVNLMGAACITAVLNALPDYSVPYVFGGDGAQLVDGLIKTDTGEGGYEIAFPEGDEGPDLTGLSCRWEPLKSCRGTMMSMLIFATGTDREKATTYGAVIDGVADILKGDDTRPVSADNMVFKWPSRGIANESKFLAGTRGRIRKWLWLYTQSFIQFLLETFDLSFGGYNAPIYREELRTNSDFRRFDDMLRMILDCPTDKADAIEAFFSGLHDEGEIAFGTHRSEHALMTCPVFSLTKGEHVHFVDGSDGGFAMAAVGLKGQMKALVDGQVAR